MTGVDDAQREFLRIVDVTERISDRKTCFSIAGVDLWVGMTGAMRSYEYHKKLKGQTRLRMNHVVDQLT